MRFASLVLWLASSAGFLALLLQAFTVRRFLRRAPPRACDSPGISLLKPLCGTDDGLAESLEAFASLAYPAFELLLGVKDAADPAFPLATACARRHPGRVRVVLQRVAAGFNPKVNQLIGLAEAARHEILVVSDSNVRAPAGYLEEIAAAFADPKVGCVSNPVAGGGHRSLGSLLDNLHLASGIGAGQIAAKCVSGKDLVVGKSMALRRADLAALGGFAAFKDYLAEDYVIGQQVTGLLGKRVLIARCPVVNFSTERRVADFARRYMRWSVIHRTAIQPSTYLAQALLNPLPLAVLALLCAPTLVATAAVGALMILKAAIDLSTAGALSNATFGGAGTAAVWLKDAILFYAWVRGLFVRSVLWRGNLLRVGAGSRLLDRDRLPAPETSSLAVSLDHRVGLGHGLG